jgi:PKHD-type hydroxylase
MYKVITNNPDEREFITHSWTYWDDGFSEEELKKMESYFSSHEIEKAKILGSENIEVTEKIRRSRIKFYEKNQETNWIFEKFNSIIMTLNELYYNFNLNGYSSFQYTEYRDSDMGEYNWHLDMCFGENLNNTTRKLSIIMCLSKPEIDFQGGEFQINLGNQEAPETIPFKRGRIIAFPSFLAHRVKSIIHGTRKSLVIWVTGPKFV